MNVDNTLIKSYSRLVNQRKKTIDDVPDKYKDKVLEKLSKMPPYEPNEEESLLEEI